METKTFEEWFEEEYEVDCSEIETESEFTDLLADFNPNLTIDDLREEYANLCDEYGWNYDVPEYIDP